MLRLLADADSIGHVDVLVAACKSVDWRDLWFALEATVLHFPDLELLPDAPDSEVWARCQREQVVLVTSNRNYDGEQSLEATIRLRGRADDLPVITIADPQRLLHDRRYAALVAERFIERLIDIESLRGTGRVYIP